MFDENIDWQDKSIPLLWLFNLHYFSYLYLLDKKQQVKIIRDWISQNPIGNQPGWHSYPLSLRIVNWIKSGLNDEETYRNLFKQIAYLSRNLEYFHPANHYLENAKALIFAGIFFSEEISGDKWLTKGLEIFAKEAETQILADGVYFEKSVMYHVIMLEGLLDIINILPSDNSYLETIISYARKMLEYLKYSSHPDGSIALLNDSTEEVAPQSHWLFDYAERLNIKAGQNKVSKFFDKSEILTYS